MIQFPRGARRRRESALLALAPVLMAVASVIRPATLDALVISEIMYHSSEAEDKPYEYIELYNENLDPLDLSGFRFTEGVAFEFPEGTWLDGHSLLVVCASPAVIQAKYGIKNTAGGWTGALDNSGERLSLANPGGRVVAEVRYNDGGKWPVGADGTGHSLSLIRPFLEVDDPDSWLLSAELGGTPGKANSADFATGDGLTPPSSGLDASGFVVKWLVLGPYTGSGCGIGVARLTRDWLRESAGGVVETDLIWRDGQVVRTNYSLAESDGLHPNAGTALPTIKEYAGYSDTINLNDSVWPPDPEQVMAYTFVYVDNVTASAIPVDIACASDDAIVVLVNGTTVHSNDVCRAGGNPGEVQDRAPATLAVGKNLVTVKVFEQGGGWNFRLRFEERGTGRAIRSKSKIQITTDPDKGLLFGGGGTPIEPPDEEPPPPPDLGDLPKSPLAINEAYLSAGDSWIELYNRTASAIDISGYHLTNDPSDLTRSTLGAGTSIPGGGFLVVRAADLGLDLSPPAAGDDRFVALVDAAGDRVLDAANFHPAYAGLSEARVPDGDSEFTDAAAQTPGASNLIDVNDDVVINEVMYHPIDNGTDREYVELFNRGGVPVDLSGWQFTSGVNFTFPAGASIPAGGYIVVARKPVLLRSIYGLSASEVLGPEDTPEAQDAFGVLRDSGERVTLKDALGRTVDTVRYHDGGEWPRWPDGLGSSLELIDPYADNRIGQAWDASDDSTKAETREYTYIGRHGGGDSELSVLLLAQGITVVDDISIIGGGTQVSDTPLVETGEEWRYFKGTEEPPADWTSLSFVDTSWARGPTGIGYGDGDDATELSDMQGNYLTVFCRKTFTLADPSTIDELVLGIVVDDGFHAYLNGTQVASYNVAGTAFDSPASSAIEPQLIERDISSFKHLLLAGTNVLAIQVHNANLPSTDLSLIPRLVDRTTTVVGGSEQVQNGTFDTNTQGWMLDGTHVRSGRTTVDPIRGAGSLKIIASGRGDNKTNRIETPDRSGIGLGSLNANENLSISFVARWVVGSQTLLTHGYDHSMAKAHSLAVPPNLGTPGRLNSVARRLMEETGEANLGPLIADVSQDLPVPEAGEEVTVTARIVDPDGVAWAKLYYSLGDPAPTMTAVSMTPVGADYYRAVIPGRALGTRVLFYIAAADQTGKTGRYPLDVVRRTHPLVLDPSRPSVHDHLYAIYKHDVKDVGTPYNSYRFWMSSADEAYLDSRIHLSNDPVPGSFLFGARRIYHGASTRFAGSPFARGKWGSFRVTMPRDDSLHGRIRRFSLDYHHSSGLDGRERISHYLIRKNQGSIGAPYSDAQTIVRWQVNDRGGSILEHIWTPDLQFLSLWYPDDDDGDFFELDDRFLINDDGGMISNTDARVLYPPSSSRGDGDGGNKENYRWFFNLRAKNGADDYSNLIELAHLLDPAATPDAALDAQIFDRVNVEEMLRIWAIRFNTDDWDQWGGGRGKNCYFYRPAESGLWELIPWDMELTYGGTGSFLIPETPAEPFNPGGFSEVNRLFNRPAIRRMYYGILKEMVIGPNPWFNSGALSTYMQKLAAMGIGSTDKGMPGGFIDQRAAILEPRIRSVVYPQTRLRITTNGGNNFSTTGLSVDFAGTAPAEVATIVVTTNGSEGISYPMIFPTMTTWTMPKVALIPGANDLNFLGFDLRGSLVDTDAIRVTSTAPAWNAPSITAVDPAAAPPGADVEIRGTDFHNGLKVFFGDAASPVVSFDESGPRPDRISARVPDGSGTIQVTVRNLDGKVSPGSPFTYISAGSNFVRGDTNGDGGVDVSDAVSVLLYLFRGAAVDCQDAADANDDEAVNITDAFHILNYLFRDGPAPAPPFPGSGLDPSGTALGCER